MTIKDFSSGDNHSHHSPYQRLMEWFTMRQFTPRPGTNTVIFRLKSPFPDIGIFNTVVNSLTKKNPLGCTSYHSAKKHHPPLQVVREMYTAKFVYLDSDGRQIGIGLDRYDSVEGYETGIAAVISNMANIASHRGKVKHVPETDLFSVLLKCHDPNGELYFLSIARSRITLSSYIDNEIEKRVRQWADSLQETIRPGI